MEPEVKKDKTEAESESSNDEICCRAENGALVNNLETMELELETDNDNSKTESERSGERVYCRAGNLSEDSEAPILALESDSDKLDTDFEHSGYKECYGAECGALLDSCFCSQK